MEYDELLMSTATHAGTAYGARAVLRLTVTEEGTAARLDVMVAAGAGPEGARAICDQEEAAPWLVLHGLPCRTAIELVAATLAEVDTEVAEAFRTTNLESARLAQIVFRSGVDFDDPEAVRAAMQEAEEQLRAESN